MRLRTLLACAGLVAGTLAAVSPAHAASTRYEAESAPAVCTGAIESNWAGYSGSGFCNGANAAGAHAQFTVTAGAGGAATLRIRFANGTTGSRPAGLTVNGAAAGTLSFEGTGAWSTWQTATVTVPVNSGANTVRLNPTTSAGLPNLDYLDAETGGEQPANTLYVATNGDDAGPGTLASPLRTIQRAVDLAQPGHTILIRGGTYAPGTNIRILKDGTPAQPITMTAHDGERVIIDGENMPHTPGAVGSSIPRAERGAVHIEGDHWRLAGLEIINGPYGIFGLDASGNVFDRLVTRDNYESGLHLQGASSGNLIVDLDSHGNRDPRKNGESADGVAIKEGSGSGNVIRGARLWNNSDDGLDFWMFLGQVTVESSVAWGNGFNRWNLPDYTGDGNGFKLGGGDPDPAVGHAVRNSMAFDNAVHGFTDNGNPGRLVTDRSTAWRNGGTGFDYADSVSVLTRNLSVANRTQAAPGSSSSSGNSWDLGGTWTLASTDSGTITGPRAADGSIRSSSFLRPANGADVGARL
ncbi:right-handed parallel beta-helix repeat-containing protein [Nonomuraea ferruginea]|uniref:Carbohydrate-binding protein n=1 Tax=Nonomuraea ferruginea TaxID=46174 RepID=A0ABT4STE1_9ACTN|nr:carbohydrate-binding protein [Nonomuraea ferruginea]MDA0640335.1 carbohydrate-binding protein [Nonomuraea ferruginea]